MTTESKHCNLCEALSKDSGAFIKIEQGEDRSLCMRKLINDLYNNQGLPDLDDGEFHHVAENWKDGKLVSRMIDGVLYRRHWGGRRAVR